MAYPTHQPLLLAAVILSLLSACAPTQTGPDPEQIKDEVATTVALTLTALPTILQPTNTPLATATESLPPTPTFVLPPTLAPTATPNPKPAYACDIINQKPLDDTVLRRRESFDIRWTIVNIGTKQWEDGTYLEYQSGPEMTDVTRLELPTLKPGEHEDIVLDAAAPNELDRQIMVWAVYGPGTDKDTTYWMCYPYVRIIVER